MPNTWRTPWAYSRWMRYSPMEGEVFICLEAKLTWPVGWVKARSGLVVGGPGAGGARAVLAAGGDVRDVGPFWHILAFVAAANRDGSRSDPALDVAVCGRRNAREGNAFDFAPARPTLRRSTKQPEHADGRRHQECPKGGQVSRLQPRRCFFWPGEADRR